MLKSSCERLHVWMLRVQIQLGIMAAWHHFPLLCFFLLSVNNNMENLKVSFEKRRKLAGLHYKQF